MVLQLMTQHDAIYQVGSLIMMNDGPSLLSLELALKWVSKSLHHDYNQWKILNKIDIEKKGVLDSYYPFKCATVKIEFWVRFHSLITSSRMKMHMVS